MHPLPSSKRGHGERRPPRSRSRNSHSKEGGECPRRHSSPRLQVGVRPLRSTRRERGERSRNSRSLAHGVRLRRHSQPPMPGARPRPLQRHSRQPHPGMLPQRNNREHGEQRDLPPLGAGSRRGMLRSLHRKRQGRITGGRRSLEFLHSNSRARPPGMRPAIHPRHCNHSPHRHLARAALARHGGNRLPPRPPTIPGRNSQPPLNRARGRSPSSSPRPLLPRWAVLLPCRPGNSRAASELPRAHPV